MSNGGTCFLFYTLAPNRVLFLSVHLPLSPLSSPFLYFLFSPWKASMYLLPCFPNPLYKPQSLMTFSLVAPWVASKNARKTIWIDHEKRHAGQMLADSSFWRSLSQFEYVEEKKMSVLLFFIEQGGKKSTGNWCPVMYIPQSVWVCVCVCSLTLWPQVPCRCAPLHGGGIAQTEKSTSTAFLNGLPGEGGQGRQRRGL